MKVFSDTIIIDKEKINNQKNIETYLKGLNLNIIRWAVVEVSTNNYTVDYSYIT